VLYDGNCTKVRNANIVLHLAINIVASLVLGANSYGMQILSAPACVDI
jgi:hypothetical protein